MRLVRAGAGSALSATLILSAASPAAADDIVDETPPVITSTGVTEGQVLGNLSPIIPTFSDDVGVIQVRVLIDGVFRGGRAPGVAATTGVPVTLYATDNNRDVDLTVQAVDAARNIGEATTRVHLDSVAPSVTFAPAQYAILHGKATITATPDAADTTEVVLSWGGKELSRATAAPWALTWDTAVHTGKTARLKVTAKDRAGNEATYYQQYRIDNVGPVISLLDVPALVGPGATNLYAYGRDLSKVARIEWWVDGVRRAAGEAYTHDFGRKSRVATVTVKAWDKLGHASSASRQVTVDATGPAVTWLSPKSGVLLRGKTVQTSIRAVDAHTAVEALLGNNASGYLTCKPICSHKALLVEGRQNLVWYVYDRFGNATVVRRPVIVDNTKASLKVTKAPKNKAKVKGTVKITASASDKNGVARVELLVNGKVVAKDVKAAYKFSVNTKKYGKKIKIQLRAYDKAGNVTTTSTRTWYRK
ncbi:Ig-like domain-containing protein [Actinoplanes sp. CA-015351]|uniref:Ig-like domain-containing protein n=1 Tax=Actinoplanes sp. CA-015351 TaxID=3239897 RepID=UPI003D952644